MTFSRKTTKLAAAAFGALFVLSGCGFQPIYGRSAGAANEVLARTEIAPIGDRVGQMLRNELIDRFYFDGRPAQPDYRLDVDLVSTVSDIDLRKDATSTLRQVRMVATYRLSDRAGQVVGQGSARAINNFAIAQSEYTTLSAERDALARAAEEVASEIARRAATTLADLEAASRAGPSGS